MGRQMRTHVAGGTYYVALYRTQQPPLFGEAQDYDRFEGIIGEVLASTDARVHAYCWTPHDATLVVQVGEVSLSAVVQRAAALYSRMFNRRYGLKGYVFDDRYRAALLRETAQILVVIRHIHLTPVLAELAADPADYLRCSHLTYIGRQKARWLTTRWLLSQFDLSEQSELEAYQSFMSAGVPAQESALASRQTLARTLSRAQLSVLRSLKPAAANKSQPDVMLKRIAEAVARKLDVKVDALRSSSRRRTLSLARALVSWHATRDHLATLEQVGKYLDRDRSTLCIAQARYRESRPDLFDETLSALLYPDANALSFTTHPVSAEGRSLSIEAQDLDNPLLQ